MDWELCEPKREDKKSPGDSVDEPDPDKRLVKASLAPPLAELDDVFSDKIEDMRSLEEEVVLGALL